MKVRGGGYEDNVTSSTYDVIGIEYQESAKVGDALDISKIQITLKTDSKNEQSNSNQQTFSPKETYDYLKSKSEPFSLTIKAVGEKIISFGESNEHFPQCNPFTFKDAGSVEISISGAIGKNEVSASCSLNVEAKKRPDNHKDLLKMILGESEYNEIKAKLESASPDFTLTAEIIRAVGDRYGDILTTAEYDKEVKENAAAFVAQAEGLVNITKKENKIPDMFFGDEMESVEGWREYAESQSNNTVYEIDEYKVPIKFINEFDLKEFQFPKNNGKGDLDDATLIYTEPITIDSNLLCVAFEKLQDARIDFFPTIRIKRNYLTVQGSTSGMIAIFNLYKIYGEQDKLDKIKIIQEE